VIHRFDTDDLEAAQELARRVSMEEPEPGSYAVVGVLRASGDR